MKRKINGKFITALVTASLCLSGCGVIETVTTESSKPAEITTTESSKPAEVTATESNVKLDIDVDGMLEAADQEAARLEKKLAEDATLTQSDMNELSQEIYIIWDDLLNELWGILKENLDQETMDKLLKEQRTWIADKESKVKQEAAEFAGGSMAALAANQKAAELTKERAYVLAKYIRD